MGAAAKLKRKLEDEAGIVFKKIDDRWEAVYVGDTTTMLVAHHKYLGDCVLLAAKELGE